MIDEKTKQAISQLHELTLLYQSYVNNITKSKKAMAKITEQQSELKRIIFQNVKVKGEGSRFIKLEGPYVMQVQSALSGIFFHEVEDLR